MATSILKSSLQRFITATLISIACAILVVNILYQLRLFDYLAAVTEFVVT